VEPVPDIPPHHIVSNINAFRVIDVREPNEWEGDLPALPFAERRALSEIHTWLPTVPRDEPVLLICRSGRRSMRAAQALAAAGGKPTNLQGGMLAWYASGVSP